MLNFINLLASASEIPFKSPAHETVHTILTTVIIILMAIAAVATIVLVLMQQSNSSGIDALGGSSETYYGKEKGKSVEAQMKKWTWICLIVLGVLAILFYALHIPALWT